MRTRTSAWTALLTRSATSRWCSAATASPATKTLWRPMINRIANRLSFTPCHAAVLVGIALCMLVPARAALITEPATIFYGKVFDVTTGQGHQLLEGELTWVIRRSDGVN